MRADQRDQSAAAATAHALGTPRRHMLAHLAGPPIAPNR